MEPKICLTMVSIRDRGQKTKLVFNWLIHKSLFKIWQKYSTFLYVKFEGGYTVTIKAS